MTDCRAGLWSRQPAARPRILDRFHQGTMNGTKAAQSGDKSTEEHDDHQLQAPRPSAPRSHAARKHLIDGLARGAVGRREFMRYGSVPGPSAPMLGGVTSALGFGLAPGLARAGTPGATLRDGQIVPAAAINPVTIADSGGLTVMSQFGEALVLSAPDLSAQPLLAESWSPNPDSRRPACARPPS